MKSGSELVRVGLRTFFENAAEDLERTFENLKLGKFTHSRSQMKGVSQNINYTTVALLPILTALFEHITQHHFGVDLLCESCGQRIDRFVGEAAKKFSNQVSVGGLLNHLQRDNTPTFTKCLTLFPPSEKRVVWRLSQDLNVVVPTQW